MARERIGRVQRRLRELRTRGSTSTPGAEANASSAEPGPPGAAAEASEDAEPTEEATPEPGSVPPEEPEAEARPRSRTVTLGDLGEGSRESLAGRLQALRGRGGRSSDGPAAPGGSSIGGAASGAGRRIADSWKALPQTTRARIAAFAIVAAIAALVLILVDSGAPCEAPGGEACPSGDDAIALVPEDALAYAHLDAEEGTAQFEDAAEVSSRLPLLSRLAVAGVSNVAGTRIDYETDVQPWSGGELALTLLQGDEAPERVLMIEAADPEGATEFAQGLLGPEPASREVAGSQLSVGRSGLASTILDGFLMIGDEDALASLVEAPDDDGTLEGAAGPALDQLPDERLAYGYLSAEGARALLANDPSLSSLDTFVDADASAGVAAALSFDDGSVDLAVRSLLDPERAQESPSFFAALPRFEPTLEAEVSPDALAYLGLGDPAASVESLLIQAAATTPALLAAFNRVEEDLRREGGISITEDLLPLLGSEAAVAVEPAAARSEPDTPGVLASSGVPYLSVIADGVDSAAAAKSLATLQQPLIDALAPASSGKVASFQSTEIGEVEAQSLVVNPDVELTYATFDERLVAATNPLGIEQAQAGGEGLEGSDAFDLATENIPEEVSLLAYLNLQDLLAIGEQIGLAADPVYATYAQDLRNLDAAALGVDSSGATIRTDLRITVGEPEAPAMDASPVSGE